MQADLEFQDIEFIDDADLDEEDIDKVIERTNLVKNQINSIAGSMANFIDQHIQKHHRTARQRLRK